MAASEQSEIVPEAARLNEHQQAQSVLTHFPLCPHSRSVRLLMSELGLSFTLDEQRPWEWPPELLNLNPAGELPVLRPAGQSALCGSYAISEFLAEWCQQARDPQRVEPFPGDATERAEARRLVDWFHNKLHGEATRELLAEKVMPVLASGLQAAPDPDILRAVRQNLRHHLSYIGFLTEQRGWLGGSRLSFADLAAGAHVSVADYLGEVPWEAFAAARAWYQRLKSRPSFRALLTDRIPGIPPASCYADLDF